MNNTISIHFDDESIISAKFNHSVVSYRYFTFRLLHVTFSLILSAKRSKKAFFP